MMMKQNNYLKSCRSSVMCVMLAAVVAVATGGTNVSAQSKSNNTPRYEGYGGSLNLGAGISYYQYLDHNVPYLSANFEIGIAPQFTLAPFIGFATDRSNAYYDGSHNRYYYRRTIVPIGVKGTYYFDNLLNAGRDWDFYLAGSIGLITATTSWDNGYTGDRGIARDVSPLFLDLHVGTEYHVSRKVGLFLDLSTGVSTIGVAIHRNR